MNKKGFTLVELLAVIALLAFLTVLIAPNMVNVKNSVVNSTLRSKIKGIHSAAIDYATDRLNMVPFPITTTYTPGTYTYSSDCLQVKISTLVELNYLAVSTSYQGSTNEDNGSENEDMVRTDVINPATNESLNEKFVCVRYDSNKAMDRALVAYIYNECDLYTLVDYKNECLRGE